MFESYGRFLSFYWLKVSQLRFIFLFCLLIIQYAETLIRYIDTYYATYIYIYINRLLLRKTIGVVENFGFHVFIFGLKCHINYFVLYI